MRDKTHEILFMTLSPPFPRGGSRPSSSPDLSDLIRFFFFILLVIATIGLILLVLNRKRKEPHKTQLDDDDTRIYDARM